MGSSLGCPGPLAQSWEASAERGRAWEGLGQTRKEAFQENLVLNLASTPCLSSLRALGGKLGGELPCGHCMLSVPFLSFHQSQDPSPGTCHRWIKNQGPWHDL